jgi:hypothetical protein
MHNIGQTLIPTQHVDERIGDEALSDNADDEKSVCREGSISVS